MNTDERIEAAAEYYEQEKGMTEAAARILALDAIERCDDAAGQDAWEAAQ